MRNFTAICGCVALTLVLALPSAYAEEKVDNPLYKHWAQFRPGSYSTLKTVATVAGMKTESTMTQTLKSITAEKAVVEITMVTKIAGQEQKLPGRKQEILAKVSKQEAKMQLEPKGKIKEGKEKITVAGKKVAAKWIETVVKHEQITVKSKVWTSDEIPGQVAKIVAKMEGPMKTTSEGTVVKFKADKK